MIGNPGETTARPSSSLGTTDMGAGSAVCARALFLSAAVLITTPTAYGDDAQGPGIAPEEALVGARQGHDDSTQTAASYSDAKQSAEDQATRLLGSAIEEWPAQALDLGLCDGS